MQPLEGCSIIGSLQLQKVLGGKELEVSRLTHVALLYIHIHFHSAQVEDTAHKVDCMHMTYGEPNRAVFGVEVVLPKFGLA